MSLLADEQYDMIAGTTRLYQAVRELRPQTTLIEFLPVMKRCVGCGCRGHLWQGLLDLGVREIVSTTLPDLTDTVDGPICSGRREVGCTRL